MYGKNNILINSIWHKITENDCYLCAGMSLANVSQVKDATVDVIQRPSSSFIESMENYIPEFL